ncbi:MAG: hypothetical protein AAFZ63_02955 [Bacteroidota bacterium]
MKCHWLGSLIILLVQIGFFLLAFHLFYPLSLEWQSSFAPRSEYVFVGALVIFIITSSIQWLVSNILRGDFRYGIAVANFLLIAYGTFNEKYVANSFVVLSSALIGLFFGQLLYYQIFRARSSPQHPINSNILDDEL